MAKKTKQKTASSATALAAYTMYAPEVLKPHIRTFWAGMAARLKDAGRGGVPARLTWNQSEEDLWRSTPCASLGFIFWIGKLMRPCWRWRDVRRIWGIRSLDRPADFSLKRDWDGRRGNPAPTCFNIVPRPWPRWPRVSADHPPESGGVSGQPRDE